MKTIRSKVNVLMVVIVGLVFVLLGVDIFLESQKDTKFQLMSELNKQESLYSEMMIDGLMFNSSSGVYSRNSKDTTALETMKQSVEKLEELNKQVYKKIESTHDLSALARKLYEQARQAKQFTQDDMATKLRIWRQVKHDIAEMQKEIHGELVSARKLFFQYKKQ